MSHFLPYLPQRKLILWQHSSHMKTLCKLTKLKEISRATSKSKQKSKTVKIMICKE